MDVGYNSSITPKVTQRIVESKQETTTRQRGRFTAGPPPLDPKKTPLPTTPAKEGLEKLPKATESQATQQDERVKGAVGFIMGKRTPVLKATPTKVEAESPEMGKKEIENKIKANKEEIKLLKKVILILKVKTKKTNSDTKDELVKLLKEVNQEIAKTKNSNKLKELEKLKHDVLQQLEETDTELELYHEEIVEAERQRDALLKENQELEQLPIEKRLSPPPFRQSPELKREIEKQASTDSEFIPRVTQEEKTKVLEHLSTKALKLAKSEDLGGHGGNRLESVDVDGVTHHLFLKPLDPKDLSELRNYQVIEHLCPELMQHMPTVYGKATIGGTEYLVMENTRTEGARQLADIKLSGKVEGRPDLNPICNQGEMVAVHGKKKPKLDEIQMGLGARWAGNYIFYKGNKLARLKNMPHSRENLLKVLDGMSKENKLKLLKEITKITSKLFASGVATIGVSMILVKDKEGGVKPILIDPAHIIIDPEHREKLVNKFPPDEFNKIYFGESLDSDEFKIQQTSNAVSLLQIMEDIKSTIK